MRFGELYVQLLATKGDWVKLNYDLLKECIPGGTFLQVMLEEIVLVSAFFSKKRKQISAKFERKGADFLRQWQVLNYLAVLKACKKHDKLNPSTPVKEVVLKVLMQQAFVKDLANTPLFSSTKSEIDCAICYCKMVSPFTLKCKHTFCYICLKDCYLNGHSKCPLCRNEQSLDPVNQTIDLVLGVVATKYYPALVFNPERETIPQHSAPMAPQLALAPKKLVRKARKVKYRIKDQERRKRITRALEKLGKVAQTEETDRSMIINTAAEKLRALETEKEQLVAYLVSNRSMLVTMANLRVPSWVMTMTGNVVQVSHPMLHFCEFPSDLVLHRNITSSWSSRFYTLQNTPLDFAQITRALNNGMAPNLKVTHVFKSYTGVTKRQVVCLTPFVEPIARETLLFAAALPLPTHVNHIAKLPAVPHIDTQPSNMPLKSMFGKLNGLLGVSFNPRNMRTTRF